MLECLISLWFNVSSRFIWYSNSYYIIDSSRIKYSKSYYIEEQRISISSFTKIEFSLTFKIWTLIPIGDFNNTHKWFQNIHTPSRFYSVYSIIPINCMFLLFHPFIFSVIEDIEHFLEENTLLLWCLRLQKYWMVTFIWTHYIDTRVASFFGDQCYLVSFWLTNLFHDWTFNFFRKREKSSNYPILKRFRVRGLVIFREGVSTLNIHSILWEPLDFYLINCAINLLAFKKKME